MDEQQIMEAGVNKEKKLPSFLSKLLSIVNDPNTDAYISWGSSGTSIIIWDHIEFSANLLPEYFKHSNFSSFVYQLNNYGFRKIGLDVWEYENPWFQAGKEYLLANIVRRTSKPRTVALRSYQDVTVAPQIFQASCSDVSNNNLLEAKVEALRSEIRESGIEIEELKRQQAEIELQMVEFQNFQAKYEKIVNFLGRERDETVAVEANRKRKRGSPESSVEVENEIVAGFENLEGNVNGDEADDNSEHANSFEDDLSWKQMLENSSENEEPIGHQMKKEQAEPELLQDWRVWLLI